MNGNLNELYSLRKKFSVIGLTGRTGSGCSEIANLLSKKFSDLKNIREASILSYSVFQKKFEITKKYTEVNWKTYKIIEYRKVLLLILLPRLNSNPNNEQLKDYYRDRLHIETDPQIISNLKKEIQELIKKNKNLVKKISSLGEIDKIKDFKKLTELDAIFWGQEFNILADEIDNKLKAHGVTSRVMLLHHTASNLRKSGQPFKTDKIDTENIYKISSVINRIIKATKQESIHGECHVVIDSLRNSLEINFFKERYSAFYLVAVKGDNRESRISEKYKSETEETIKRLLEMDEAEYKCSDFQKGNFYVPDVQNCIQAADYHMNNHIIPDEFFNNSSEKSFYSLEEQLMKLQGLIQQPGLITPEPAERVMQIAYTAKFNSGCISRQVGAVVTDKDFSTKAIGWNDVPKGAMPCSLRNIKDIDSKNGFTSFELGEGFKETEPVNKNTDTRDRAIDSESIQFNKYIKDHYNESTLPSDKLAGRNCPYCFKSTYNAFSGDKNQVHTRSLHAEENAMMQISKYGGQGLKGGYLFTTASPCELCAKKAYQLGIDTIYFIDPYPGISRNHILKSMKNHDPKMILFSGAVGRAYHKLYEPFLPQKDELVLLTNFKLPKPENTNIKTFKAILNDKLDRNHALKVKLESILRNEETMFEELMNLLDKGLDSSEA